MLVTDHDSGGYDMDDSEIGVVLMAAAVLQLMFQVYTLYSTYIHVLILLTLHILKAPQLKQYYIYAVYCVYANRMQVKF